MIVILVPYSMAQFIYTVQTHKSSKVKSIDWINSIICQSKNEHFADKIMTPTWLEHAAFWSGVRRATIAPRSRLRKEAKIYVNKQNPNLTNIVLEF